MPQIDSEELQQLVLNDKTVAPFFVDYLVAAINKLEKAHADHEILYQTMIPLNPRTKKNHQEIRKNRKTGKRFVAQGDIYKQYEKDCKWFIKPPEKPLTGPLNIRCIFYKENARICDLTNLLEAIDDILVKYKVIEDDNFNVLAAHDGSRVFIDRDNPRTEITITSMGGNV